MAFVITILKNQSYSSHEFTVPKLFNKSYLTKYLEICFRSEPANTSIHTHILNEHNNLNLNLFPANSFYNMLTTINDNKRKNDQNVQTQQSKQISKSLLSNLPSEFHVYLCLNCRLFFKSDSSFSHNCWNIMETLENNAKSDKTKNANRNNSNNANYFSPVYLKFNVSKFLLNSKLKNASQNQNSNNSDVSRNQESPDNTPEIVQEEPLVNSC
jgi:hypothetical protein